MAQAVHEGGVVPAGEQGRAPLGGGHADEEVPGQSGKLPQQGPHVLAPGVEAVEQEQCPLHIPPEDVIHELRCLEGSGEPQHLQYPVPIDSPPRAGTLVQQAQGVPEGPVGQAGQEARRLLRQVHALLLRHEAETALDILGPDALEGEALAPGEDGGRNLVELGGGQDEDEVGRGLLQDLQQGVESGGGEHVDLVDDIHPVADAGGGVYGLVPEGADVVHAVVGGGVQLHHVQEAAVIDALAGGAHPAGVPVLGLLAVDGLGEDLGTGGLSGAPGAGEEVGVAQPVLGHLAAEGGGDVLLTHHVGEDLGPPLAVERLIHVHSP